VFVSTDIRFFVHDTEHQMRCTNPFRIRGIFALSLLSVFFALANIQRSFAQEPPTSVPAGGPPPAAGAIPYETWLLYPSLTQFSQYSSNYFLGPTAKIAGWGFGVSPALTATWSNGIHTTTFSGTYTHIDYPTQNEIITDDGEATLTQRYAPLRDLSFTFSGDYSHHTIAPGLMNASAGGISQPSSYFLPNGNEVLPNGQIINPTTLMIVGQISPALSVNGQQIVNPYDQYTATAQVDKQFGGEGILSISDSMRQLDYDKTNSLDFASNTVSDNASFWLGSVFYIYTNGTFTRADPQTGSGVDVYSATAGIGTRQVGLFRGNLYAGYQGSRTDGASAAGGEVFGGSLTYYPTPLWTVAANFAETINLAPSGAAASNFALSTGVPNALQIPLTASTQTAASTLSSTYKLTPQWTVNGTLGYTHAQYLGSQAWDDSYFTDVILRYDILRDLTLSWEYRYTSIVSDVPSTSAASNFLTMSAQYKF
jgi:Putative beta-barrel porin 2